MWEYSQKCSCVENGDITVATSLPVAMLSIRLVLCSQHLSAYSPLGVGTSIICTCMFQYPGMLVVSMHAL